jgi:hypothetical protein
MKKRQKNIDIEKWKFGESIQMMEINIDDLFCDILIALNLMIDISSLQQLLCFYAYSCYQCIFMIPIYKRHKI